MTRTETLTCVGLPPPHAEDAAEKVAERYASEGDWCTTRTPLRRRAARITAESVAHTASKSVSPGDAWETSGWGKSDSVRPSAGAARADLPTCRRNFAHTGKSAAVARRVPRCRRIEPHRFDDPQGLGRYGRGSSPVPSGWRVASGF